MNNRKFGITAFFKNRIGVKRLLLRFFIVAVVIIAGGLSSQLFTQPNDKAKHIYNEAERYEAIDDYAKALPLYKELVAQYPENENYNFKLGLVLAETNDHEDPIPYLEKACLNVNKKYKSNYKQTAAPPIALFYLAKEYHLNYKFAAAHAKYLEYEQYLNYSEIKEKEKITVIKEYCRSGLDLMKDPKNVKHLDFSEAEGVMNFAHSPVFSPDGTVYIFTTDQRPGEEATIESNKIYDENIYYTYFSNGSWQDAKLLSSNIFSTKNEASIGVHPNGEQLFVYRNDNEDGNLYYSDLLEKNVWSKLKKFPSPINSMAQESHITMSADGNTVYFTSDRSGGYGGLDIYVCKKDSKGRWGKAINLGPKINTMYHEESPHLQVNGNTLYFSSDRLESMGGFDIFSCEMVDDSIATTVKNLGYPINTPLNDLFFKTTIDGSTGYYSTPCRASHGELDLNIVHFLDIPRKANVRVRGLVFNAEHDTLYDLHINLFDIGKRDIVDSTINRLPDKYYEFDLYSENRYFASFEYDGYVYFSKPFEIDKYFACLSFSNIIELEPIVLDDSTFRQSKSDFIITQRLMKESNGAPLADSLNQYDIVKKLSGEEVAHLTREETGLKMSIDTSKPKTIAIEEPIDSIIYDIIEITDVLPQDLGLIQDEISLVGDLPPNPYKGKRAVADSIKREGIRKFDEKDYNDAGGNFLDAIDIFRELGDVPEQLDCMNRLAASYYALGNTNIAIHTHKEAVALAGENHLKSKGDHLYAIGTIYDDIYVRSNALKYLHKSQEVRHEAKDRLGELESVGKIGDVHYKHRSFNKAIHYYDIAIGITDDLKLEERSAEFYNKKGLSRQALYQYNNALKNYNVALDIATKYKNKKSQSIYMNNIANVKYAQTEYRDAINNYTKSIELKREIDYLDGLAVSLHNLANSHRKLDEHNDALRYYHESLEISEKKDMSQLQAFNHFGLSQSYAAKEVYDKALHHFKKYIDYRSPYLNSYMNLQASQEILKYEIDQKDISVLKRKMQKEELFARLEAERYANQIVYLEQAAKRQQIFIIMSIVLSAGALSLLILLLFAIRNKRRTFAQLKQCNTEINQKQEEITAQRESLENINKELEKLSIVASKTSNSVAIIDSNKNFEWQNESFIESYAQCALVINAGESIYQLSDSPAVKDQIDLFYETKSSIDFEHEHVKENGDKEWMQTSLTPIIFDDKIYKVILIESEITSIKEAEIEIREQRDMIEQQRDEIMEQRDVAISQKDEIEGQKDQIQQAIDELHRTQKKLVESEKMASLGNLVAGVAHEINTPVGIGIAASTSLATKTKDIKTLFNDKKMKQSDLLTYLQTAKDAAKLIQTNLHRAGDLVKSFKRVSVDEVTEQMRKFNLNEYLKEVVVSLDPKIKGSGVTVSINCPEEIILKSYPGVFAQLVTNFVVNSLTHAYKEKKEGQLIFDVSDKDESYVLVYSDDGSGMTDEVKEKVFNPFFTTNMQTGTGLGMNIVYNIVTQKLKGDIVCKSELGKGTRFIITIPKNAVAVK